MAQFLLYTSPARGHLYPAIGTAVELKARGHGVHVRTLASEVDLVRSLGLHAEPIAPAIEAREMDDWRARNPLAALEFAMKAFGDRGRLEIDDVGAALDETKADALLVDTNTWGAQAVAEASGRPWATFQPYFTPLPAVGVPPFGPGLARSATVAGRVRDAILRRLIFSKMDRVAMPAVNDMRQRVGLGTLAGVTELLSRPPRVFYFTTEALEYPRAHWPEGFRMVGPATWAPQADPPDWLAGVTRPIALVTCSTERQSDRGIIEAALAGLPKLGMSVIATSAAYGPEEFADAGSPNCRVERFLSHGPVVARARVVVCHGGMGITQRALSHGVPVVVVPFGRDQFEVARRVEHAGAGVRLMPRNLNAGMLTAAVTKALSMADGAGRIAASFAASDADAAVADGLEELLVNRRASVA
ncbi:MAG: glycosyltransferase [Spirochaetaceae bacterium]|nr:MAG: glycosyltransferase [Spirochaetaceae bacterium]